MQRMDGEGPIWPTEPATFAQMTVPEWDLQPGEQVEVIYKPFMGGTAWASTGRPSSFADGPPTFRVGEDGATIMDILNYQHHNSKSLKRFQKLKFDTSNPNNKIQNYS